MELLCYLSERLQTRRVFEDLAGKPVEVQVSFIDKCATNCRLKLTPTSYRYSLNTANIDNPVTTSIEMTTV